MIMKGRNWMNGNSNGNTGKQYKKRSNFLPPQVTSLFFKQVSVDYNSALRSISIIQHHPATFLLPGQACFL